MIKLDNMWTSLVWCVTLKAVHAWTKWKWVLNDDDESIKPFLNSYETKLTKLQKIEELLTNCSRLRCAPFQIDSLCEETFSWWNYESICMACVSTQQTMELYNTINSEYLALSSEVGIVLSLSAAKW